LAYSARVCEFMNKPFPPFVAGFDASDSAWVSPLGNA